MLKALVIHKPLLRFTAHLFPGVVGHIGKKVAWLGKHLGKVWVLVGLCVI